MKVRTLITLAQLLYDSRNTYHHVLDEIYSLKDNEFDFVMSYVERMNHNEKRR